MADVTDAAFRRIIAKYGKPDVIFNEFVSCDGLCSDGKKKLLPFLKYTEKERPIVAQVFGATPENFYKTARLIKKLGFDGIDINMGCPDKKIQKQGAGAALIKNPKLAQEIILQTKKAAGTRLSGGQAREIPVSVKTRIGYDKYDKKEFKEWLIALLECKPAAITIHGRTKKEMSLVPANWEIIGEAVKTRDKFDPSKNTLIFGNGDVKTVAEAYEKAERYGVDGVMIGRGVFGKPWLFASREKSWETRGQVNILRRVGAHPVSGKGEARKILTCPEENFETAKKLSVLMEHAKLFEKINHGQKFDVMKKHFKAYVSGFDRVKELRVKLMSAKNAQEVEKILKKIINDSKK